jgi:hypothetical protein
MEPFVDFGLFEWLAALALWRFASRGWKRLRARRSESWLRTDAALDTTATNQPVDISSRQSHG